MSEQLDELLTCLADAPSNEIDPSIIKKIRELIGKTAEEAVEPLTEILKECANEKLVSDFSMKALDKTIEVVQKMAKNDALEIHLPN